MFYLGLGVTIHGLRIPFIGRPFLLYTLQHPRQAIAITIYNLPETWFTWNTCPFNHVINQLCALLQTLMSMYTIHTQPSCFVFINGVVVPLSSFVFFVFLRSTILGNK